VAFFLGASFFLNLNEASFSLKKEKKKRAQKPSNRNVVDLRGSKAENLFQ